MSITKIAEVTATGSTASITLSSIPGTFTDLLCYTSTRSATGGNVDITVQVNGSGTGYSVRWLYGSGSGVGSGNSTTAYAGYTTVSGATANTFANCSLYIPNYAGSTNKSWSIDSVAENNGTTAFSGINAGLWSNTAAITSITFNTTDGSNWASGTSMTLYGVTKGSSGGVTVA
jgi:hypothetical protein